MPDDESNDMKDKSIHEQPHRGPQSSPESASLAVPRRPSTSAAITSDEPTHTGAHSPTRVDRPVTSREGQPRTTRSTSLPSLSPLGNIWPLVKYVFSQDGRELRKQLSIWLRAIFTFSQVIVVIVLLSLSGTIWAAKNDPHISEWRGCDRPLGAWSTLWGVRACFNLLMHGWEWRRYWDRRRRQAPRDVENPASRSAVLPRSPGPLPASEIRAPPSTSVPLGRPSSYSVPIVTHQATQPSISAVERGVEVERTRPQPVQASRNARAPDSSDQMFDRMDTILTILGIVHFVGNNIFLYTSVYSCRVVSPHVWWLAFGIVCLGYVIVVELLLIAFVVFVLGPFLLLVLNILMLCLGRRVDANGNPQIHAEIPKMDKRLLEFIPLKIYIPSKEEPAEDAALNATNGTSVNLTYPPISPTKIADSSAVTSTAPPTSNRHDGFFGALFHRLRPSKALRGPLQAKLSSVEPENAYEAQFESGPYPFIQLEKNRATCYICLSDFVPPRRRVEKDKQPPPEDIGPTLQGDSKTPGQGGKGGAGEVGAATGVEHPGVPGEPLRVLSCGHVFHVRRRGLPKPIVVLTIGDFKVDIKGKGNQGTE
ncbi:hypothetical protein FRB99_005119 [Tulasnella sp. 403]|nr:hypothetical protein FRB99_005119 [Tulasnella sp. 403]